MTDMTPLARGSVQTWECDQMGHMNVQFYVERAVHALAAIGVHLGLGPRTLRENGWAFEPADHHIRFLKEQRPGAPFVISGGVTAVNGDTLSLYCEMANSVSGDVAAAILTEAHLIDAASGAPAALPETARASAEKLKVALPAHGAPRGVGRQAPLEAPGLEAADAKGMFATWQARVEPYQLNDHGVLASRFMMGAVSDSIPNLLAQTRGEDRSAGSGIGGAALEYRFVYRARPRAGDVLTLRSGLKEVGNKTYTWVHWMFDLETGEAVATAEAVAVAMDLQTRRAIAIPDEMRAHLESRIVPGIGV